jgi:hypothetical protein
MVKSGKGGDENLKRFFFVWLKLKIEAKIIFYPFTQICIISHKGTIFSQNTNSVSESIFIFRYFFFLIVLYLYLILTTIALEQLTTERQGYYVIKVVSYQVVSYLDRDVSYRGKNV